MKALLVLCRSERKKTRLMILGECQLLYLSDNADIICEGKLIVQAGGVWRMSSHLLMGKSAVPVQF
jgi:hypothetical protein